MASRTFITIILFSTALLAQPVKETSFDSTNYLDLMIEEMSSKPPARFFNEYDGRMQEMLASYRRMGKGPGSGGVIVAGTSVQIQGKKRPDLVPLEYAFLLVLEFFSKDTVKDLLDRGFASGDISKLETWAKPPEDRTDPEFIRKIKNHPSAFLLAPTKEQLTAASDQEIGDFILDYQNAKNELWRERMIDVFEKIGDHSQRVLLSYLWEQAQVMNINHPFDASLEQIKGFRVMHRELIEKGVFQKDAEKNKEQ
ncbi:MAG: hypothetical protein QNK37_30390 [Acidobacteriota bacterium]|nr:hypothetical protein [Acidobacteriota bacterium]